MCLCTYKRVCVSVYAYVNMRVSVCACVCARECVYVCSKLQCTYPNVIVFVTNSMKNKYNSWVYGIVVKSAGPRYRVQFQAES